MSLEKGADAGTEVQAGALGCLLPSPHSLNPSDTSPR